MVDIVTGMVAVLSAGATAGLKDTVGQAVKDAYASVKNLLKEKLTSLPNLEEDPTDEDYRNAVAKEIQKKGLAHDSQILDKIHKLTLALEEEPEDRLAAWSVDIQQVRAFGNIMIADIDSGGSTRIKGLEAKSGDVRIERVKAGGKEKN
jgi:hypothetical protein